MPSLFRSATATEVGKLPTGKVRSQLDYEPAGGKGELEFHLVASEILDRRKRYCVALLEHFGFGSETSA